MHMMTTADFINRIAELYNRNVEIARNKNNDYAESGDPFKNFRGCERHGVPLPLGIMVRMEDKMARLGNLLQKEPSVVGESVLDTALDLANYAVILAVWWENEHRSDQKNVLGRSDIVHLNRLHGSPPGTVGIFPLSGSNSDLNAKHRNRDNLHDPIGD